MAISIDWPAQNIFVPKVDTVFLGTDAVTGREIRTINTQTFHRDVRILWESDEGRAFPRTHDFSSETIIDGVSYAAFLEIIGGYSITFEPDGVDPYRIILEESNNNILSVTTVNSVSVQPTNSAGLIGSKEIQNQSYLGGKVFINSSLGTATGIGTPTDPVDTYANAITIANQRNLNSFDITGSIALTASDNIVSKKFFSDTPLNATITLTNVDTTSAYFENINVSGSCSASQTGPASFKECFLGTITNFWGSTKDCIFYDDITQHASATGIIIHDNARSGVSGDRRFTYDVNAAIADLMWRNYVGGQTVANVTQGFISYDGLSMRLELLASCTGGEIVIGGTYRLTDSSVGTTVVTDSGVDNIVWNKVLP